MSYSRLDPSAMTALVTGATAGIGEACARRFLAEGARVIATGRRTDRLAALGSGDRLRTIALDVRDREAVFGAIGGLAPPFDAIDVCVANAGLALGAGKFQDGDPDDWDRMIATNLNGLVYTVKAVLPGMIARGRGTVVLMGSIGGAYPTPTSNVYGATKAFVNHLALQLRADLAGTPVRVVSIEPGMTSTEFLAIRTKDDPANAANHYATVDAMTADDIAEAVFWATTMPARVNVNRLQLMPVAQAFGPYVVTRKG